MKMENKPVNACERDPKLQKILVLCAFGALLSLTLPFVITKAYAEQAEIQRQITEEKDTGVTYANWHRPDNGFQRVKVISVQPGLFTLENQNGQKIHALSGYLSYTK
jgi:hypothetical protein